MYKTNINSNKSIEKRVSVSVNIRKKLAKNLENPLKKMWVKTEEKKNSKKPKFT